MNLNVAKFCFQVTRPPPPPKEDNKPKAEVAPEATPKVENKSPWALCHVALVVLFIGVFGGLAWFWTRPADSGSSSAKTVGQYGSTNEDVV